MWSNYHTHSTYCDGKNSLDEIIEAAAGHVFSLGFSSHAPTPFDKAWSMKRELFAAYQEHVQILKWKNERLQFDAGLEVDFIPGVISPSDFSEKLDYTIGSIHFVDSFPDGEPWEIDGPETVFEKGLELIFNGDIEKAVRRYFTLTRQMIVEAKPTIVGHLDKIKMQNRNRSFFSESESWYKDEIMETLLVIRGSDSIVEVNTRGLYKQRTSDTYPSRWVLEQIRNLKIPITLSSDAHRSEELTAQFGETAQQLLSIGMDKVQILQNGKWSEAKLTPNGIEA